MTINLHAEPFPTVHMHCKHEKEALLARCFTVYHVVARKQLSNFHTRLLSAVSLPSRGTIYHAGDNIDKPNSLNNPISTFLYPRWFKETLQKVPFLFWAVPQPIPSQTSFPHFHIIGHCYYDSPFSLALQAFLLICLYLFVSSW